MVPLSNNRSEISPRRTGTRPDRPRTAAPPLPDTGRERSRRRILERRTTILRAAGRAFRRNGFARTGMRDIAREAGLSPANLYYYFPGKNALLEFCQDHALERMLGAVRRVRRAHAGARDRLRDAVRAQVLCMLDDLAGAAAHLEVDALPSPLRGRIIRKRDRYERALRRIIQEGVRERSLETADPALAARAILGAVNWTARWYDPGGTRRPAEIAELFADFLVRGLSRPVEGASRR